MERLRSRRSSLVLAGILLWVTGVRSATLQTVHGPRPAAAIPAQDAGRVPADQLLDFTLGLPLRQTGKLTNFLAELNRPFSPNYRRFLTPEQFTAQFGPAAADYAALTNFACAHQFIVRRTHSNRTLLAVRAAARQIEEAFHVEMHFYRHPTENRLFYAPDREPSLDLSVPLLAIGGLDNYFLPHPASLNLRPLSATALNSGSGPGGNFLGSDFRAAYLPGISLTGAGQAIGLFELDSYYPSDITQYAALANLTNILVSNVVVDNFTNAPGTNNSEVALDIEMALAMAPQAKVLVYEGSTPGDILNQMATDDLASQLSCSWTFSPVDASTEQILQQFAAQGQSIFQASGDSGALTGVIPPPCDNPWVTSVGGTELTTSGPGGSWESETVWNWNTTGQGNHGSSGGSSPEWGIPVWQQGIDMSANGGSLTARNIPDVAMVADHIWIVASDGRTFAEAGTSAAAPLWAGVMALANQEAANEGQPPVGFANSSLYALARGEQYPSLFHDIVSGNNTNLSTASEFFAEPGYDLCTGWGTPAGSNLLSSLADSPQFHLMISNGGFETASFWGWVLDASGFVTLVGSGSSYYASSVHSGKFGAYLAQSGSLGYLSQTLATTPGQPCLISFWLANPVGGVPSEFLVSWGGTILSDQTNLPAFAWTNMEFVVPASTTNTVLEFGFRQDADAFGLDDIGVMAVPAPSIQSIVASGSGFVLQWTGWQGLTYQVQYTTNLAVGSWNDLGPPLLATNAVMNYCDLPSEDTQRFYRIVVMP